MNKKLKVLFQGDSPTSATGFSRSNKLILQFLHDTGLFDFTIVAVNLFDSWYDQNKYPYKMHSAIFDSDPQGFNLFASILEREQFDVVFIHNDLSCIYKMFPSVVKAVKKNPKLKTIFYTPIDNDFDSYQLMLPYTMADLPIVYSDFGKKVIERSVPEAKLTRIYLPSSDKDFYRYSDSERKQARRKVFETIKAINEDTFVIGNISRNQARKDLARSMMIFKKFKDELRKEQGKDPNVFYYMHSHVSDVGGDLALQAMANGLTDKDIAFPPASLHTSKMVAQSEFLDIYNSLDMTFSTNTGEGHGLLMPESMLTRTPMLMPRNTTHTEYLGENEERGYLMDSGKTDSEKVVFYGYDNAPRNLCNVEDGVKKLMYIYKHYEEAKAKTEGAFKFAKDNFDINLIKDQWIQLLKQNKIIQ